MVPINQSVVFVGRDSGPSEFGHPISVHNHFDPLVSQSLDLSPMSKRQGGAAAPPPPLPPGPQPQHDAAAIHAAAWQQYYVSRVAKGIHAELIK